MKTKITLLIALISWFMSLESIQAQTPEILYYTFNGVGTTVPNLALTPPVGSENATIMGGITQGGVGQCETTALVGSGVSSSSDYLNTNWAPNLGTSSWTISFWSSGISNNATLYYIFGDANTASFRCFTNGVAGANNWILRGAGLTDVLLTGGALTTPTLNTFVYDNVANNVKAYLNGVLVNTVAQGTPSVTGAGPFKVMGYASNVGAPNGGMLDEFRLYNRALTNTEISGLAGNTQAPIATSPITYSQGATATSLTATGTNLLWYTSSTGGTGDPTAPTPSTSITGTTSYWVSQTTTCGEGPRTQIDVIVVGQASALKFDGSDDKVVIGNTLNSILSPLNTITVEAWVNPTNTVFNGVIVGNYYNSNNEMQFLLRRDFDTFTFWVNDGTGYKVVDSGLASVTINTWQHVAGVWDGSSLYIYIDGVLKGTTTGVTGSSFAFTNNDVIIGSNSYPENYAGSIDELRIWNRALNQCEIQNNMNGELPSGQTGLLAYYQFNQGIASADNTAITSLTDSSGNNYNGTLSNFTLTGTTSNWINPGGVSTNTISPIYNTPNVNTVTSQTICSNSATTPVTFSSSTTGTICGQTNEGGNITLTAPLGAVFTSILFASYGTPNGTCGNYSLGSCHAPNSVSLVSASAIGQNNFSITANNGTFGDPCAFTSKRMYIQAVYNNTTFNWTNNTPSIGLASSGTGSIPSFNAVNTGTTPVVATITVTPLINGCAGTPIQFNITVNPIPAVPTGASTQVINGGVATDATIEDIVVNPTTVIWYASLSDALSGTNALSAGTQLIDGAEYFAVNQENGCKSAPLAVTVTVILGKDTFDSGNFNLYPNPTSGAITLQYSHEITEVSILNMLGQTMLDKKLNATETTIDLSNLPSATYFVKIVSEGKIKMVKVIKR